jgi:hypothetical protein
MKYLHLKMDKLRDAANSRKKVLTLVKRTNLEPNKTRVIIRSG